MAYMLVETAGRVLVADVVERHDMKDGHSKVKLLTTLPEELRRDPWGRPTAEPVAEWERIVPTEWIHENDQAVII